ncbi:MAG: GDP-mannose 4,6-dehydratase [Aureliella sp.]
MPRALVTGVSGQDGFYIAELLIGLGYEVHGATRGNAPKRLSEIRDRHAGRVAVHSYSQEDPTCWRTLIERIEPHEVYHLAADSFVPNGWDDPIANSVTNYHPVLELLEAIRDISPRTKLLNACSREVFGNAATLAANETTPMRPTTMYGIHKAASRWAVETYRERYGLLVCSAILFNHESPRRPENFVTRKITKAAAEISRGLRDSLELGNTSAQRDWSYAGDIVDAMHRMMQLEQPEDFVLGSGTPASISQFAEHAFKAVSLDWRNFVKESTKLHRGNESGVITADSSKAITYLKWRATTCIGELARAMVEHDLSLLDHQHRDAV